MRFGRAEEAILKELRRVGGPVPRRLLVGIVYANSWSESKVRSRRRADLAPVPQGRARRYTESTLSRALRSLERKGLVVRVVNQPTRETLISMTDPPAPPAWEREALAELAFAAQCDAKSAELAELAQRARKRAVRLREERSLRSTRHERAGDVAQGRPLIRRRHC